MSALVDNSMALVDKGEDSVAQATDLIQAGRPRDAAAMLERLLLRTPNSGVCRYLCGLAHTLSGALPEAERWLREAIATDPKNAHAQYNLAVVLMRLQRFEDAVYTLLNAIDALPNDLDMIEKMADYSSAICWFEAAITHRQRLISRQPDNPHHTVALSNDLARFDRPGEATAMIANVIDEVRNDPYLLAKAIRPLWLMGDLEAVERGLRAIIAERPDRAEAHCDLGTVLLQRRKAKESIVSFDKALALDPDLADAWYNRGIACEIRNDVAGAIESYKQALAVSPNHGEATVQTENLWLTNVAYDIIKRVDAGQSTVDLIERLRHKLRVDKSWLHGGVSYLRSVGLLDPLRNLLERMAAGRDLTPQTTWTALASTLVAQHTNVAQLDYEVECYGHADFRTLPSFCSPFLTYLRVPAGALLAEAAALYDAVLALPGTPDADTVRAACEVALRQHDLDRAVRLIEGYQARTREMPLPLNNLLAFIQHVRGQSRVARLMLDLNHDGYVRIPCAYADARAVAEKSHVLTPTPDSTGAQENIDMRLRLIRDGQAVDLDSSVNLPPCSFHHFSNVKLLNDHGTLLTHDDYVVRQTINCDPGRYIGGWPDLEYSLGDIAQTCYLDAITRIEEPVAIAAYSRDQTNYAHWMLDVLPRILLVSENSELDDHLIVVTHDLTKWQREVLELMGVDLNRVVSVEDRMPVEFAHAVLPVTSDGLYFLPDALRLLRQRFLATDLMSKTRPTRKIFVTRKANFRHLLNDDEVAARLADYGFETVSPGELTVAEQVRLFSETEVLVATGGAAVTNMLFMPVGSRALVFGPSSNYGNYYTYLARLIGVEYMGLVGDPHPDLKNVYIGWNYRVDMADLEMALDLLQAKG